MVEALIYLLPTRLCLQLFLKLALLFLLRLGFLPEWRQFVVKVELKITRDNLTSCLRYINSCVLLCDAPQNGLPMIKTLGPLTPYWAFASEPLSGEGGVLNLHTIYREISLSFLDLAIYFLLFDSPQNGI